MKYLAEKCVQAHNEAEKRKALGHPAIDPRMAAKQKKPVVAQIEAPRQEEPRIVFSSSMTGSKPKVTSTASELKKTRATEAEAKKRKHKDASDDAPSKKKLKTKGSKSSKKSCAAASKPLVVDPISVAYPASANHERRLVVHEPTSTEALVSEEVPAIDPNAVEDIGHEDNVVDDEVLPQLEHQLVSSPAPTSSEYISICRPLTPIAQDDSWAERPQEETPVRDATPVLHQRKSPAQW